MVGHIKKRSKHSYSLVVTIGYDAATGKPNQKWFTVKGNKKDAEKELNRIIAELNSGTFVTPTKYTVAEYLSRWLKDYAENRVGQKTYERYEAIVNQHLVASLGSIALTKLQPLHIQRYYADALRAGRLDGRQGGLSARTVLHHHRLLHKALNMAVKWQLLQRNPALAVEPPRPLARQVAVLDEAGTVALIEKARGTRVHIPIVLAACCGLRRGEILALRWKDVDLTAGALIVNRSVEETKLGIRFKSPKSARSHRPVTIPGLAVEELLQHRSRQQAIQADLGISTDEDRLVCSSEDGSLWKPSAFTSAYRDLLRRRGLLGPNFHALRHSHASHLIRNGADPKIVSSRLGHSRTAFTLDTYAHILPGQDADAARRADIALRAAMDRCSPTPISNSLASGIQTAMPRGGNAGEDDA